MDAAGVKQNEICAQLVKIRDNVKAHVGIMTRETTIPL